MILDIGNLNIVKGTRMESKIEINNADQQLLLLATGIGPVISKRVIGERDKALFVDAEDLSTRVRGISYRMADERFTFSGDLSEQET